MGARKTRSFRQGAPISMAPRQLRKTAASRAAAPRVWASIKAMTGMVNKGDFWALYSADSRFRPAATRKSGRPAGAHRLAAAATDGRSAPPAPRKSRMAPATSWVDQACNCSAM